MGTVRRIFVEKKPGFDVAAQHLYSDLSGYLGIAGLQQVRLLIRYDIEDISDEEYQSALHTIFSEPPVDYVYEENLSVGKDEMAFAFEYLPGQYDQRADSAAQCVQIMGLAKDRAGPPSVRVAHVVVLRGDVSPLDMETAQRYLINPVDSHRASLDKPDTLHEELPSPPDVEVLAGFTGMADTGLEKLRVDLGLAMSCGDIVHCRHYFAENEKRDPTLTEIRMLDTYWSDHCRHTTFLSVIENVEFANNRFTVPIKDAYDLYLAGRDEIDSSKKKPQCLMDIALMGVGLLRKRGLLDDLEISREINACSIVVPAEIDGHEEDWLVMFKNETHNHPTEIEPFGGAATCLGGAIRDPLSGRSYVYQAMRVTGCGDPRKTLSETMPGKLPQRKITVEAAHGYSSYGNQIGLATGIVSEIYNEGYLAKRMEIGAVIAAAPRDNVVRGEPAPGDVVILVGGRTGRDGCGGATGSSKSHSEESIKTCGAEVQKGNPTTERKIQRLFRIPEVSRMIKVCNDFGAGGVSVAVGELADSLLIDLDSVPKKYEGLDGTELTISESQERMAVLIDKRDQTAFIKHAHRENLEATRIATVTDNRRVTILWRGKPIVDISRDFIDTNGVPQHARVRVASPVPADDPFCHKLPEVASAGKNMGRAWLGCLANLNVCSQKGLVERFDSTIGAAGVLLPFGGAYQDTPAECMVAKLPVLEGDTTTGTIMSWGYDPALALWSPFHAAVYAVVHAVAKLVAAGGDFRRARLTLQEYFEKLGKDETRWGKPFAALLGAFKAQVELGVPAIGGKDSMSGTFEEISVPPTLVAIAVCPTDVRTTISPELKRPDSKLVFIPSMRDDREMPDFGHLRLLFERIATLIHQGKLLSVHTIGVGGIAAAVTRMALGNRTGVRFVECMEPNDLFSAQYGSMLCEIPGSDDAAALFHGLAHVTIATTTSTGTIEMGEMNLPLERARAQWEKPLAGIFPPRAKSVDPAPRIAYVSRNTARPKTRSAKPRVFIPIFPGTNCEYDTARAFERAGGVAEMFVVNNLTPTETDASLTEMARRIDNSQIVMIPGGFSAGDEPEGSGKFIAAVLRNPSIRDAVHRLLKERDGLMLGICNGFQALIKLGLVPHGEIRNQTDESPTLTFNTIGRHISRMVRTRVSSTLSPWFAGVDEGDVHSLAISHGEGRFVASNDVMTSLIEAGQIATQYCELDGAPAVTIDANPNGSMSAVEGITSPDGRILGKMGHSERAGAYVARNISGEKDQKLFESGVGYFG